LELSSAYSPCRAKLQVGRFLHSQCSPKVGLKEQRVPAAVKGHSIIIKPLFCIGRLWLKSTQLWKHGIWSIEFSEQYDKALLGDNF
jgi:hypothetical protein